MSLTTTIPDTTCHMHTDMGADTYVGWHARRDWFLSQGYHHLRCFQCGRFRIFVSPDGRMVASFTEEFRRAVE